MRRIHARPAQAAREFEGREPMAAAIIILRELLYMYFIDLQVKRQAGCGRELMSGHLAPMRKAS